MLAWLRVQSRHLRMPVDQVSTLIPLVGASLGAWHPHPIGGCLVGGRGILIPLVGASLGAWHPHPIGGCLVGGVAPLSHWWVPRWGVAPSSHWWVPRWGRGTLISLVGASLGAWHTTNKAPPSITVSHSQTGSFVTS